MSIRQDQAQLVITIDAKESAEYQKSVQRSAELTRNLKKMEVGSKEYIATLEEQARISKKLAETDYTKLSVKNLADRRRALQEQLRILPQVTAQELGLENELKKVNQALSDNAARTRATRQVMEQTGGAMSKFSNIIKGVFGAVIAYDFISVLKNGFASIITSAADFEAAMAKVRAVSADLTQEGFEQLQAKALELGETTSKTATEAAEGLQYLALAGFSTAEQLEAIEPVLRLSEAGSIDLALASDLATDAMSSLGLGADELGIFLDKVANTSTLSNTSIQQLNEAFIRSGGLLRSLNVPLDEANALFGVLANRGEKGSEAGTGLNAVLINLTTGAGQAGKGMEALGLSAFDADGNFKGVSNVLAELNTKLAGMTQEQQNTYKAMIGGKQNIGTLNALLSGVSEEFGELSGKIAESEGKLNDVAETLLDNTKGSWTLFKSALDGLAISIGQRLLPIVNGMIKGATAFIGVIRAIPDFVRENEVAIKALVAGMILFNGQLILSSANSLRLAAAEKARLIWTRAATTAQTLLNTAMTANPIGLVLKAVGLLVAGFGVLYSKSETVRAGIAGLGAVAKEIFTIITEAVGEFIKGWDQLRDGDIGGALKSFGNGLRKANPLGIAFTEGKRLKEAFDKGYNDKKAAEAAEKKAEKQAQDLIKSSAGLDRPAAAVQDIPIPDETTEAAAKDKSKKKEKAKKDIKAAIPFLYDPAFYQAALQYRIAEIEKGAESELLALEEMYLQGNITAEQYELDRLRIQQEGLVKRIQTLDQYGLTETEQRRSLNVELLKLDQELINARVQQILDMSTEEFDQLELQFLQGLITEEEYQLRRLQTQESFYANQLNLLNEAGLAETEAFRDIKMEQAKTQAEINEQMVANEKEKQEKIENTINSGFSAAKDIFREGAELLKMDEKSKKKHSNAIRAFEIANIKINTAAEISSIWRAAAANPTNYIIPGWANIYAGIQTALAVTRAARQIAQVSSAKYERGGSLKDGAVFTGPSHTMGGIPFSVGGQINEAEGGEIIINKRSSQIFGPVLDAINTYNGYGRRLFETGGMVRLPNTQPSGISASIINPNASTPTTAPSDPRVETLANAVSDLVRVMPMALSNIKANVSYFDIQEKGDTLNEIRRISSIN